MTRVTKKFLQSLTETNHLPKDFDRRSPCTKLINSCNQCVTGNIEDAQKKIEVLQI